MENFIPLEVLNRSTGSGIPVNYFFYMIWHVHWRIVFPLFIPRLVTLSLRAKYSVKTAKNCSYFSLVQYVEIIVCILHNIDTLVHTTHHKEAIVASGNESVHPFSKSRRIKLRVVSKS